MIRMSRVRTVRTVRARVRAMRAVRETRTIRAMRAETSNKRKESSLRRCDLTHTTITLIPVRNRSFLISNPFTPALSTL
jgi:hypothetical protein